jgi:hypothetical protein
MAVSSLFLSDSLSFAGGNFNSETQVELEGRRSGSFPDLRIENFGFNCEAPSKGRRGAAVAKRRT